MKVVQPKNLKELMELIKRAKEEGADVEIVNENTGETGIDGLLRSLREGGAGKAGDALEKIFKGSGHTGGEDCPACNSNDSGITDSSPDAAHALLNVVAIHQKPPVYKPGTFVRYRDDIKYVSDARALHVVVELISSPREVPLTDSNNGRNVNYRRYDCMVAKYSKIVGTAIHLADSRELELYPDADKLMGKHS